MAYHLIYIERDYMFAINLCFVNVSTGVLSWAFVGVCRFIHKTFFYLQMFNRNGMFQCRIAVELFFR